MNQHWAAAWGVGVSSKKAMLCQYAKDMTLRYYLKMFVSGEKIRLHFSNLFGEDAALLSRVTVMPRGKKEEMQEVLFAGKNRGEIPAHGELDSDPLSFPVEAGMEIAVSLYFSECTPLSTGVTCSGPHCQGGYAKGDRCGDPELTFGDSVEMSSYFLLNRLDVYTDEKVKTLIAFGDSITSQSWPDWLMDRLSEKGRKDLAVVRSAISGNRVLREYRNLQHIDYGPTGVERFEKEISIPGADRVIVLEGVNDIIHPDGIHPYRPWAHLPTAEELIEGLRTYIRIAHAHGLKIYLCTITSIGGWRTDAENRQEIRRKVNEWILKGGEADGVIDFAAAVADPENPIALLPEYDSGDHLHPSVEGAKCMAGSIPEDFLA